MQKMNAEIIFDDRTLAEGKALLEQQGFDVEVYDFVLEEYPAMVWVMAEIDTDMSDVDFLYWVTRIVDPVKGFVVARPRKKCWPPWWAARGRSKSRSSCKQVTGLAKSS